MVFVDFGVIKDCKNLEMSYGEICVKCNKCGRFKTGNTHYVKTLVRYFKDTKSGIKTFTIRKNDRDYKLGDFLIKQEFDGENYTGRELLTQITYMTDYQQKDGYVVMGLKIIEEVSE